MPKLTGDWGLSDAEQSWMMMSVQLGFVAGAIVSALLNLADRMPTPRLIAVSAALAGVYPPGMKLVVSWFNVDRGLGIGILIGALAIGSASPHLLNGVSILGDKGMPGWPNVVLTTSGMALVGSVIVALFVRSGPHAGATAPFDWRFAGRTLAHRPTRLANYGYLGHMWELYAMWTWAPAAASWPGCSPIGSGGRPSPPRA